MRSRFLRVFPRIVHLALLCGCCASLWPFRVPVWLQNEWPAAAVFRGPPGGTSLSLWLLPTLYLHTSPGRQLRRRAIRPLPRSKKSEKVKVLIAHLCPTLWDPMDCSPPGFSVHRILQARILEWVGIPFSRGSSQPEDQTQSPALQINSLPSELRGKPSVIQPKASAFVSPCSRTLVILKHKTRKPREANKGN